MSSAEKGPCKLRAQNDALNVTAWKLSETKAKGVREWEKIKDDSGMKARETKGGKQVYSNSQRGEKNVGSNQDCLFSTE